MYLVKESKTTHLLAFLGRIPKVLTLACSALSLGFGIAIPPFNSTTPHDVISHNQDTTQQTSSNSITLPTTHSVTKPEPKPTLQPRRYSDLLSALIGAGILAYCIWSLSTRNLNQKELMPEKQHFAKVSQAKETLQTIKTESGYTYKRSLTHTPKQETEGEEKQQQWREPQAEDVSRLCNAITNIIDDQVPGIKNAKTRLLVEQGSTTTAVNQVDTLLSGLEELKNGLSNVQKTPTSWANKKKRVQKLAYCMAYYGLEMANAPQNKNIPYLDNMLDLTRRLSKKISSLSAPATQKQPSVIKPQVPTLQKNVETLIQEQHMQTTPKTEGANQEITPKQADEISRLCNIVIVIIDNEIPFITKTKKSLLNIKLKTTKTEVKKACDNSIANVDHLNLMLQRLEESVEKINGMKISSPDLAVHLRTYITKANKAKDNKKIPYLDNMISLTQNLLNQTQSVLAFAPKKQPTTRITEPVNTTRTTNAIKWGEGTFSARKNFLVGHFNSCFPTEYLKKITTTTPGPEETHGIVASFNATSEIFTKTAPHNPLVA